MEINLFPPTVKSIEISIFYFFLLTLTPSLNRIDWIKIKIKELGKQNLIGGSGEAERFHLEIELDHTVLSSFRFFRLMTTI